MIDIVIHEGILVPTTRTARKALEVFPGWDRDHGFLKNITEEVIAKLKASGFTVEPAKEV